MFLLVLKIHPIPLIGVIVGSDIPDHPLQNHVILKVQPLGLFFLGKINIYRERGEEGQLYHYIFQVRYKKRKTNCINTNM